MPSPPDESPLAKLRRQLDALEEKWPEIEAELAKVDAEAETKRRAILERMGVPGELLAFVGKKLSLPGATNNATINPMPSTEIVAHEKKRRGPPSEGPVTDLATELGYASMQELADALDEDSVNLRSWNRRKSIPSRVEPAIARLRIKRLGRGSKKRNEKA